MVRARSLLVKVAIVKISKCCPFQRSHLVSLTLLSEHQEKRVNSWDTEVPHVVILSLDRGNATWLL